jgi:hypothetical protein
MGSEKSINVDAMTVPCQICNAGIGEPCRSSTGKSHNTHSSRWHDAHRIDFNARMASDQVARNDVVIAAHQGISDGETMKNMAVEIRRLTRLVDQFVQIAEYAKDDTPFAIIGPGEVK